MDDKAIKNLIDLAAKEGAKQALMDVGLKDHEAADDIKELRSLLDSWKETKATVGRTIAQLLTTAILTALATGIFMKYGE
jgi:hypothetical protein